MTELILNVGVCKPHVSRVMGVDKISRKGIAMTYVTLVMFCYFWYMRRNLVAKAFPENVPSTIVLIAGYTGM